MNLIKILGTQMSILISILAVAYLAVILPVYALQEPVRLQNAELEILMHNLDSGMTIYAENCALCHGMAGEGIGASPPLNSEGMADSAYDSLYGTIANGRYGTAMVGWVQEYGGSLTAYEISQLVALIQAGNWNTTQERVINMGLQPLIPFAAEPDAELLLAIAELPGGDQMARGITIYSEQCVACHGADGLGSQIAPALNDPAVRSQPGEDLERAIVMGVPGTLMAGWSRILNDVDIEAVLKLITQWDTIPTGTIPEPEIPLQVTAESLALGETLYSSYCSRCHGPEGQGTPRAPALNVKGFLESTNDQAIQQITAYGVPDTIMIPWETRLSLPDIQAIVGFIRGWEPTAPEVAEPVFGMGGGGPAGQAGGSSGGGPPWMREGYPD